MAQKFYYDSGGLLESTLTDGTYSGSFSSSSSITNEGRLIDQSTSLAMSSFDYNDAVMVDFGSAKTIDFIALYFTSAEPDSIVVYSSDDGSSGSLNTTIATDFTTGWQAFSLSSGSHRYWIVRVSTAGNAVDNASEMIIGQKLEFAINPDIGISEQEIFGTAVNRSAGGVEYAVKKHNPISTWTLNFANISSTFKASLQSMEAEVQDYKKFLWYDETNYHYVRLESPIKYTEVAYQRYSASISLREQLS